MAAEGKPVAHETLDRDAIQSVIAAVAPPKKQRALALGGTAASGSRLKGP
jgi:hypothetical protein